MGTEDRKTDRREWNAVAPKQAGESQVNEGGAGSGLTKTPRIPWSWVKPVVWTSRMLAALQNGVKGGKWFSLMDKVHSDANLSAAFDAVKANKGAAGVDHQSIGMFQKAREANLSALSRQLKDGTYHPKQVRRVMIPKPGSTEKRPLGIPAVRDRVVQSALRNAIEPIFEKEFAEHSYGFRPQRGCKDALRRVQQLLNDGYHWVVDADLKSYFDTINHDKLMSLVEEKISDGAILNLIRQFLKQGIFDGVKHWEPEDGTPQGGVISPLLSNIYLNPLDHCMAVSGYEMVRYADDFVILCRSEQQAQAALEAVSGWVMEFKLTLHPQKTRIVDATQEGGFDFLGYHFERGQRWPREKSKKKIQDSIREKTKRCNGHSMKRIIENVNRSLRGWYEYFKHSNPPHVLRGLETWTRGRLRSILRKRHGGKGRARGEDQKRWPNAYFRQLGFFSLTEARAVECQSLKR